VPAAAAACCAAAALSHALGRTAATALTYTHKHKGIHKKLSHSIYTLTHAAAAAAAAALTYTRRAEPYTARPRGRKQQQQQQQFGEAQVNYGFMTSLIVCAQEPLVSVD
jgi:ABC-type sugar transport system substrate-binding protein